MAIVTFTGAATPDSKANVVIRVAGGTIGKHDAVYIDHSDNEKVKQAVSTSATTVVAFGMALHDAVTGEYVLIAINGATVTVGGGLTAKTRLVVGGAVGDLELQADLTGSEYICEFAWVNSSTELEIDIRNTGLQA